MPNDSNIAELHYLRGAELAQAGQYDPAVAALIEAIALQPGLYTARFQLGLLHLTMGRPTQAVTVWEALESAKDQAALIHFKRGLEALISDDFARCIDLLEQGIALNKTNEPLNRDMRLMIAKVRTASIAQASASASQPAATAPVRTDFSLYGAASK